MLNLEIKCEKLPTQFESHVFLNKGANSITIITQDQTQMTSLSHAGLRIAKPGDIDSVGAATYVYEEY